MLNTGAELERCLPFLQKDDGAHLLLQCQAVVVGLWHLSDPAPVTRQVLALPEMQAFEIDFDHELRQMLAVLLINQAKAQKEPSV